MVQEQLWLHQHPLYLTRLLPHIAQETEIRKLYNNQEIIISSKLLMMPREYVAPTKK